MRAARLPGAKSARTEPRSHSTPSAVFDRDRRCVSCSPEGNRRFAATLPSRGRSGKGARLRRKAHHPLAASAANRKVQSSALAHERESGSVNPYPISTIPAVGADSTARSSQTRATLGRPESQANRANAAARVAPAATVASTDASKGTVKAPAKRRPPSTPPATQTARPMSMPAKRAGPLGIEPTLGIERSQDVPSGSVVLEGNCMTG
jgi:hypothetical protein